VGVRLKNIALTMLFIYNCQFGDYRETVNFSTEEIGEKGRKELISKAESDEGFKKITGQITGKGYSKKETAAVNIKFEGGEKAVLMTFFVRGDEKIITYYFGSGEVMLGYLKRGEFRILKNFQIR
jgi:hypothetical protein